MPEPEREPTDAKDRLPEPSVVITWFEFPSAAGRVYALLICILVLVVSSLSLPL